MHSDAPRQLPPLAFLLDELGNPSAATLARHLGVSVRSVQRWLLAGKAPRAVALALFWDTRYGRSAVECRAVNDARQASVMADIRRREAETRLEQIEHLLAVGNFGSANAPLVDVAPAALSAIRPAAQDDDGRAAAPDARQAAKSAVGGPIARKAASG